jgi:hypothetical protein
MAWTVLAVMGLHSLLEYPLWYGPFQWAALLAVWVLWQTRPSRTGYTGAGSATARTLPAHLPVAIAVAVIAACSYVGWDYWRISQIYLPESQRAAAYREGALDKTRDSRLFADQVKFAELGVTPLTRDNAEHIHALALDMLHFSPEQRVVEKLINSALLLGKVEEAGYFEQRYEAAFPQDHALWQKAQGSGPGDKTP